MLTPGGAGPQFEGWERALDELEAFTYLAEAQLHTVQPLDADPWSAPDLGPIPAELADRARELLAHQQRVLDRLPSALERIRQQRSVSERFGQATSRPHSSVYVDRTA